MDCAPSEYCVYRAVMLLRAAYADPLTQLKARAADW